MVVGIMGRDVKKEMEKPEAVASDAGSKSPAAVAEEVEDVTLAPLSQTQKHERSSSKDCRRNTGEMNEKLSKVEKRLLDWKMKQALSGSGGKFSSFEHNNGANDGSHSPGEFKSSAVIRALEVRSNLEPEFPSFVKSLVRSHVASCFLMGLPGAFCKSHLPDKDVSITLEDESGRNYQVKYIACKTGLSAGWRQFSIAHKLLEGDTLVFQFIRPIKFKVYIIRANDQTEVDGALGLLNFDDNTKKNDAGKTIQEVDDNMSSGTRNRKQLKNHSLAVSVRPVCTQQPKRHENKSREIGSKVLGGSEISGTVIPFHDVKNFEDFRILIDGFSIDSELSEDTRKKYFKLCCSQNAYLHENFTQGMSSKLIAGTISDITRISDAIRASNLATSKEDFSAWEKTLRAFQLFGMNVGFIQTRVSRIANLRYKSEEAIDGRRYEEGRTARALAEDEIRTVEEKLVELKEACRRFDAVTENLNSIAENYELEFLKEAKGPW